MFAEAGERLAPNVVAYERRKHKCVSRKNEQKKKLKKTRKTRKSKKPTHGLVNVLLDKRLYSCIKRVGAKKRAELRAEVPLNGTEGAPVTDDTGEGCKASGGSSAVFFCARNNERNQ